MKKIIELGEKEICFVGGGDDVNILWQGCGVVFLVGVVIGVAGTLAFLSILKSDKKIPVFDMDLDDKTPEEKLTCIYECFGKLSEQTCPAN